MTQRKKYEEQREFHRLVEQAARAIQQVTEFSDPPSVYREADHRLMVGAFECLLSVARKQQLNCMTLLAEAQEAETNNLRERIKHLREAGNEAEPANKRKANKNGHRRAK